MGSRKVKLWRCYFCDAEELADWRFPPQGWRMNFKSEMCCPGCYETAGPVRETW